MLRGVLSVKDLRGTPSLSYKKRLWGGGVILKLNLRESKE